MKFETKCLHAGQKPEGMTGAVIIPIFQTSTYANDKLGESKGYDYGRTINPTREVLEKNLAELENGKYGYCFSSGMAAIQTLIMLFKPGDHILCSNDLYGGTYRLYRQIIKEFGVNFEFVNTSDIDAVKKAFKNNTKMLYIETPTNPMLQISDIKELSELAHSRDVLVCVDNTFASPYNQNPLDLGADIVLHSTTKYINGHTDVIGGVIITSDEKIAEKIKFLQNAIGSVPAPMDCWLILRSTKTLHLRMKTHNSNAMTIAKSIEHHPKIKKIYYPGLESHEQYDIAKKQMRGFSGIISIDLGSFDEAKNFCNKLKLFMIAESLGGVESLVCHPVSMTHGSIPDDLKSDTGLSDSIVRLSIGVEDVDDLLEDILNALK